ncbi:MAG: CopD family protein [Bacteroidota bacterium]
MLLYFFKSIHIVGFVAWFAGLFYLVRIFVYHVEAMEKPPQERAILTAQFNLMQWRVFKIICRPAMIITWICGLSMLHIHELEWLKANWWMHVKLVLLTLLTVYTEMCPRIIRKLEKGERPYTSFQFRLLNEVPTIFLLTISLLAVYRFNFNVWYTLAGIFGFGILLFTFAKLYRKRRMKSSGQ